MVKDEWDAAVPERYPFHHHHAFVGGETAAAQETWLQQRIEKARQMNIELFCRRSDSGCDFGFKNFEDFARFRLDTYGDTPSKRAHKCVQNFPNGVDPYWMKAAQMYVLAAQMNCDIDETENKLTFSFDRFSESAALRLMIEDKEIDHVAQMLRRTDQLLGRVQGFGSEPDHPFSL